MYTLESQVRYSESLHTGNMNPISIANYLQDCATFHSASLGKDIDYYKKINRGWFLNSWQIDILHYPKYGEKISINTWSYGIKGFYGYRNFTIYNERQLCACVNSVWFFTDTSTNQPVRVPKEEADAYGSEQKFPMEYCPRKIQLQIQEMQQFPAYTVKNYDIDTNHHVNNVRYIELAFQYLPKEIQRSNHIWRIRTEYKKAAKEGDIIYPYFLEEKIENENQYSFLLAAENNILSSHKNTAYANIVFYIKNRNEDKLC